MSSKLSKKASCIRRTANFSRVKPNMLIDSKTFSPEILEKAIPLAAPKIEAIVQKIRELDEHDLKHEGKLFKHIIYTDVPQANYSIKIIASALSVMGFHFAGIPIKDEEKLLETRDQNYAILLTKPFGKVSVKTKTKKEILATFNDRKKNVHGKLIRILCLSDAFKEGIDTFDVKYVHMFENTVTHADQKQAIGRATRFCGQKGLEFKPNVGWPLKVFRYNVRIPADVRKDLGTRSDTLHDMFLEYSNLDKRRINFAVDLEEATADASVDKALTEVLHVARAAKRGGADEVESKAKKSKKSSKEREKKKKRVRFAEDVVSPHGRILKSPSLVPRAAPVDNAKQDTPKRVMDARQMQTFVKKKYADLIYKTEELVNKCVDKEGKVSSSRLIEFTPSQEFVRRFFRPESAYKGILLNHSVGTGKTCSAIAATGAFESQGYTILWVTRHSLKSDVYKNIFDQVCHEGFRERLAKDPKAIPRPSASLTTAKLASQYLSSQWIGPISYKQFSNMLLKNNKYYEEMVKRNGEKDPLRKTLVIIDEAHKLYSPQTVGAEKPNTDILESMLWKSYKVSGADSARLILMTATPFTEDPTEQMQLLNLMRPKSDALPVQFDAIMRKWLSKDGHFTKEGRREYMDAVSGYVSYLDRSADARYFAQPIIEDVLVDMTTLGDRDPPKHHDVKIKALAQDIKSVNERVKEVRDKVKQDMAEIKSFYKEEMQKALGKCKDTVTSRYSSDMERIKAKKAEGIARCGTLGRGEKMPCKEHVNTVYRSEVEGTRTRKATGLEKCNNEKSKFMEKRDQELIKAQMDLNDLKSDIANKRSLKKGEADILKKFNAGNRELVAAMKAERLESKVLREALKDMRSEYKGMEDKKSKEALALRAEIKKLASQLEKMRNKVQNMKNKQKLLKMEVGRVIIGNDMAQAPFVKKCLAIEEDDEDEEEM